jgi:hypothetical protein
MPKERPGLRSWTPPGALPLGSPVTGIALAFGPDSPSAAWSPPSDLTQAETIEKGLGWAALTMLRHRCFLEVGDECGARIIAAPRCSDRRILLASPPPAESDLPISVAASAVLFCMLVAVVLIVCCPADCMVRRRRLVGGLCYAQPAT